MSAAGHPHDGAPDTADAFVRLARLADGREKTALRQELVRAWLPMADRLAGRYRNRGEALEDLRQVAALGLVKAVERYGPDRGGAFESFAVPTINGEIKRHFRDHTWTVRAAPRAGPCAAGSAPPARNSPGPAAAGSRAPPRSRGTRA